ncbi:acetamidase/formamidase family protein [Pseudokineococcus marinus]|uniref:Acetamidase n=1 Tax=Pseudokineococcus marinus TaxID=351215 RepID=A0A849C1Z7_9ACTN|nr:acetamidase/formamidase family protein [Pseudokineococcus marinus]NNH23698.1 acetamidase [Pseudokineococcus marinus]
MARTHVVEHSGDLLHGRFDADLPPRLEVASGDVLVLRTVDAGWHADEQPDLHGDGPLLLRPGRDAGRDPGHALTGPFAVAGAQPGDALEVRVRELVPGPWGWTRAGGWSSWCNDALGVADAEPELLRWALQGAPGGDGWAGTATDQHGDVVALRPFLGVVGTCPAGPGPHSTVPPRRTGGNLDCRELVAGSSLLLPVEVPGGLLSVGDGHAAQGDGEVSGLAVECPMERVVLEVVLHPGAAPPAPRATTPAGEVRFGVDADLRRATAAALEEVLELLVVRHGLSRTRALALASTVVDLRVTQVVNGVQGVHALLPPGRLLAVGGRPVDGERGVGGEQGPDAAEGPAPS